MTPRKPRDAGQAFPIYITVVAGLLFLAFAYFAVGQAAATRNGAQTAADASALAAAQEARGKLGRGLLDAIIGGSGIDDILGRPLDTAGSCAEAGRFAGRNDAELLSGYEGCRQLDDSRRGFAVKVRTLGTVGDSVIPGTEKKHATASATAVIEFRCSFEKAEADKDDKGKDKDKKPRGTLKCDGRDWTIDPDDLDLLPGADDLFSVHLAE